MRKRLSIISFVLILFLLWTGFPLPVYAKSVGTIESEKKTVRVGYTDFHGFIDEMSDGTYSGYAAEYLDKIAEYTDFNYEYVYGEWNELLTKLENKEIDLICNAQYTEERAEIFDFSVYPIGYTQGVLYTQKDNKNLYYEDFQTFDGITVGILKGSAMADFLAEYAEQNHFHYTAIEYVTEDELLNALLDHQINTMCSEHIANHQDLTLLANFVSDAFYFMSYKENPYMEEIDFALREIKTNVDFETELFHKYYDDSAISNALPFTQEERKYIESSATIVIGVMDNRSPLTYKGKHNQAVGMIPEILNMLAEKSGLQFEYVFLKEGQTGYDFLANGGGDLVAGVAVSDFSTPNSSLIKSEPVLTSDIVFVGREGTDFSVNGDLRVALPKGFIGGEKSVNEKYPNFSFYHGTTNKDCLEAIREHDADIMLQNLYIIRECLQSPLYEGLEIFPAFTFTEKQIVVALPEDEILISILNKSMETITESQVNDIVIKYTIAKGYHASVWEIMYKYRIPLSGILVLFIFVIGMFIIIVSIRQHHVAALHKVNEELETANLHLEDAVAQAGRASVAKSEFLSRMSHEIRTPMNAIVGLTTLARQHEDNPMKIDDYLNKINISSGVLLNIINDILDMSAIESNKLKISHSEFDLKQILDGISTIYYPQCQSKGIQFDFVTDISDEYLLGDSLRVNQILLNLVSNAWKFTDKGGTIKILVKETTKRNQEAFLRFIVSDTGCGMSEDMLSRIFKPFEQESSNTAQSHGGSGLGLSITKNLVDMMHGAITVESKKGEGTTFTVDLPFEIVKKEKQVLNKKMKDLRVLVIEHDTVSVEYTSTVLERIGVQFDVADSAEKAFRMLEDAEAKSRLYKVCLVDWKTPDMDGVAITRKIREHLDKDTLIIIVTTYDLSEVEEEAIKAGADYFVTKPLFQSTIFNILIKFCDKGDIEPVQKAINYDFSGCHILLAEDQELNAEIATELLELVNVTVDRVCNGKEAVEQFIQAAPNTYQLILMDVQMPEMDGYEATSTIRALDRPDAGTIPIFAMTANAFTEDVSAAISSGMNGHIAKPIDTKVLYNTIDTVFHEKE